jgi:hypothetical protein
MDVHRWYELEIHGATVYAPLSAEQAAGLDGAAMVVGEVARPAGQIADLLAGLFCVSAAGAADKTGVSSAPAAGAGDGLRRPPFLTPGWGMGPARAGGGS